MTKSKDSVRKPHKLPNIPVYNISASTQPSQLWICFQRHPHLAGGAKFMSTLKRIISYVPWSKVDAQENGKQKVGRGRKTWD